MRLLPSLIGHNRSVDGPDADDAAVEPIVGPTTTPIAPEHGRVVTPRLARHIITLDDGHEVGVAVCGRGVPLVVVHGFSAEGILYAQTLSRLVELGFKVVAIDTAGHGGTLGLPTGAASLSSYTELLGRVLDQLGIKRAVLAGHSMGGRLVAELAANEPDIAVAVILLDAIVGDTWDNMVTLFRFCPPLMSPIGVTLWVDTLTTLPFFADPRQAIKLGRLVTPTLLGHVRRPWRLFAPAVSILRSQPSKWMLDRIAQQHIPLFAIHGDRDFAVPMKTSRAAARRGHGELVVVHGGSHSWLLKDPESLPAIMYRLMQGRLGTAVLDAVMRGGVDPDGATKDEIESAFLEQGSLVARLTPDGDAAVGHEALHHRPRYRFTVSDD
jgi:pimeloyl-ACP methyl ester carboxylesterase